MPSIQSIADKLRLRKMERQMVVHPYDWEAYRRVLDQFTPRSLPKEIYLNQIWNEWKGFLDFLVPERIPKRILEIGTGSAGSTYFLTKVGGEGSLVITIDTGALAKRYVNLYKRFPKQRVYSLTGKSHDSAIISSVAKLLGGEPLDLLFIDGDHSYDGVKMDFELYQQFCNEKTIVCFHDIVADYFVTRGARYQADSGEVYKFWAELKGTHKHAEFVDSPDQDGFGIGVLLPDGAYQT
jgi:predicted O-methyltransferase YrrM